MSNQIHPAVTWAPRVLILLFAAFLTIFSMDVFQETLSIGELMVDLVLHNLPSLLLLSIAAFSWRRPWIGAVACTMLGVLYLIWSWGRFPLSSYLVIAGPLFLVAALYALNGRKRPATE